MKWSEYCLIAHNDMVLVFIVLVFVDCSAVCLSTQISSLFIELTFLSAMYVKAEHEISRQFFNHCYCQYTIVPNIKPHDSINELYWRFCFYGHVHCACKKPYLVKISSFLHLPLYKPRRPCFIFVTKSPYKTDQLTKNSWFKDITNFITKIWES